MAEKIDDRLKVEVEWLKYFLNNFREELLTPEVKKQLNELSELLKRKKLFVNKDELSDSMFNYLNVNKKNKDYKKKFFEFLNEKIYHSQIEYYFSNVF